MNDQQIQKALAVRFSSGVGERLTLRQYFHELLVAQWNQGRNSEWQHDVQRAITLGLTGRDPDFDRLAVDEPIVDSDFIESCIAAAFTSAQTTPDDPLRILLNDVEQEVRRARGLFPDPNLLTLAHAEEAGELTKAVLEEPLEDVRKEAVQAAAMALRLVLDGDPSTDAHREQQGLKKLGDRSIG
jgi:NTP pyrophosphatase (non-canonical NTP hydrolase)